MRGGLIADFAALRVPGAQNPIAAIDVIARIPVADRTFFDAVIPIGFGAIGNPMLGMHHVLRPADSVWLSLGGAVGFPLANVRGFEQFSIARALWDYQEFGAYLVPFVARADFEAHSGIAELRVQLEPAWGVSVQPSQPFGTSGAQHYFALQHALEVQVGHAIGGGLRYQGLAVATDTLGDDHYQGAVELFLRVYRDPLFARLGFVVPIDKPLGSVDTGVGSSSRTWGIRAQTGFNLD
jgi:hypothetical protein